jgi:hypothetical protein
MTVNSPEQQGQPQATPEQQQAELLRRQENERRGLNEQLETFGHQLSPEELANVMGDIKLPEG